jgi:hypothetical protein
MDIGDCPVGGRGNCSLVANKIRPLADMNLPMSGCGGHRWLLVCQVRGLAPCYATNLRTTAAEPNSQRRQSCCASSALTLKGVGSDECNGESTAGPSPASAAQLLAYCGEPAVASDNAGGPGRYAFPGGGVDGRARPFLDDAGDRRCRALAAQAAPDPDRRDRATALSRGMSPGRALRHQTGDLVPVRRSLFSPVYISGMLAPARWHQRDAAPDPPEWHATRGTP